jgi:hypothetical protein
VSLHAALQSVLVHAQVTNIHELLSIGFLSLAVLVELQTHRTAILTPLRTTRPVRSVAPVADGTSAAPLIMETRYDEFAVGRFLLTLTHGVQLLHLRLILIIFIRR